jgi:hypothetical protein
MVKGTKCPRKRNENWNIKVRSPQDSINRNSNVITRPQNNRFQDKLASSAQYYPDVCPAATADITTP